MGFTKSASERIGRNSLRHACRGLRLPCSLQVSYICGRLNEVEAARLRRGLPGRNIKITKYFLIESVEVWIQPITAITACKGSRSS
eukprot:4898237-Amphidinium_carterae.2